MTKAPHPALRATFSRKGRRDSTEDSPASPSPLAGEGGRAQARPDEGPSRRFVRTLRKNMTDAERRLWSVLRGRRFDDYKFRRQVTVGKYVADFMCYEQRLIVEVDGSQHDERARDKVRDAWLASQGFRVLRLWNRDVLLDTDGALLSILAALKEPPHPSGAARLPPSPARGEGRKTRAAQ